MSIGNEPAYPAGADLDGTWLDPATCKHWKPYVGLTKRELFAAMAMQGFIACRNNWDSEQIATASIEQADALLAQLSKAPQP